MIKIDMDMENEKHKSSVIVKGSTPVILSELTMVMHTLNREGEGFTKKMLNECVRLATQSDKELEEEVKECTDSIEGIKGELNKLKDLLSSDKDDKIGKLIDELSEEIFKKL